MTSKSEMTSSAAAAAGTDDDDDPHYPVMTQQLDGNSVLLTYFREDIDANIDRHFRRALILSQQSTAAAAAAAGTAASGRLLLYGAGAVAAAAVAGSSSSSSLVNAAAVRRPPANQSLTNNSCCRQNSSPLSQRTFPSSFWNTMASSCSSASSAYRPSRGGDRPTTTTTDPLAASSSSFTVVASSSPSSSSCLGQVLVDPYARHLNFPSVAVAVGAVSPTAGALGSALHHHPSHDLWQQHAYAFGPPHPGPPPPPPPPQSTYRRSSYRRSVHEFSFSSAADVAPSSFPGGSQFDAGVRRAGGYESFLHHGGGPPSTVTDDPKSHADFWRRSRGCYGFSSDVVSPAPVSHLGAAAGFSLTGGIEAIHQTSHPDAASVKDVYWF